MPPEDKQKHDRAAQDAGNVRWDHNPARALPHDLDTAAAELEAEAHSAPAGAKMEGQAM